MGQGCAAPPRARPATEVVVPSACLVHPQRFAQLDLSQPRSFLRAHEAFARGRERMEAQEMAEAQAEFEQAVKADPSHGLARIALAETHWLTDNDVQVIRRHLAAAVVLLPENPRAHLRFADVSAELNDSEVAIQHYECALALSPGLARAHAQLGAQLMRAGRLAEAEEQLRAALKIEPEEYRHRIVLSQILEAEARPKDAAAEVERAAKLVKTSAALFRRAARLYDAAPAPADADRMRAAADALDPPAEARELRPLRKARPAPKRRRSKRR